MLYRILLLSQLLCSSYASAKSVFYHLTASPMASKASWALGINDQIPGPTLEFEEGDQAHITLTNNLQEEVSLHWHGLLLPPEMDGVPYVNTPPILPGQSYTFRFPIKQQGTYWYHSHTMLQEQKGLFGAIVIHPKKKNLSYDRDVVLVLSDWSDENPDQIMKNLKKDGDYYLYKKKSLRSWYGALNQGALGTFLKNEWTRMGGMDLSDVGYDAFLINGQKEFFIPGNPGERLRLRIINAGASSYFYLSLGQPMTVVSADGMDIEPVEAPSLLMGMAETYDVIFQVPSGQKTELRATAQDGSGWASAWIGDGVPVFAKDIPTPPLYGSMDHHHHSSEHLTVDQIRAPQSTVYKTQGAPIELELLLGGDMERYVWFINGKSIHEDPILPIKEGDLVRWTFINNTMMHHPMHLHGHFFRVLNSHKEFSPLKHTVDVPPHGTRTIEFLADAPGEWMIHCHNLYHMKTGMARVVQYQGFKPSKELAPYRAHDPHLHDHTYFAGGVEISTLGMTLDLQAKKSRETLQMKLGGWEVFTGEFLYHRWMSSFLHLSLGFRYGGDWADGKAVVGGGYLWPFLIESQFFLDQTGRPSAALEKTIQWTSDFLSHLGAEFYQGQRPHWKADLLYQPVWALGGGVMVEEQKLGVGVSWRF
jgi:FtsP/CotA-like multicopper oxidase with cupredoxin domain